MTYPDWKTQRQGWYWIEQMRKRYPLEDEVERMFTVLYGFFAQQDEYTTILSFYNEAKRPYGNKDVPASIVYNIGWDPERLLMFQGVPEDVAEEAMKIHVGVGKRIYEEMTYALT